MDDAIRSGDSSPAAKAPFTSALATMRKIVVLRALKLGDLMCSVPALRALRAAAPHADITLISLPWATTFVRRFHHYIDHFVGVPWHAGTACGCVCSAAVSVGVAVATL